jgi:anaerobic selenocysteine-containing dehydrogenase
LLALTWLGSDAYRATDWDQALTEAADRHSGSTVEYILGVPLLPDYPESGLNQFGYTCKVFER